MQANLFAQWAGNLVANTYANSQQRLSEPYLALVGLQLQGKQQ